MEGTDESTELWQPPPSVLASFVNIVFYKLFLFLLTKLISALLSFESIRTSILLSGYCSH